MQIKVLTTFQIDIAAERARILKVFKGEPDVMGRQMAILDAFERREFSKCVELYNAPPYNVADGCSEREYVGVYFFDFFTFIQSNKNECVILPEDESKS